MLAKKGKKRKVKKSRSKPTLSKVFGTVFVLFAVYLLYTNMMIFIERTRINDSYKELSSAAESLVKEKENLKMQLGETYSEQYLEKVAREELGLQKEGEKIVVVKKIGEDGKEIKETEKKSTNIFDEIFNWMLIKVNGSSE